MFCEDSGKKTNIKIILGIILGILIWGLMMVGMIWGIMRYEQGGLGKSKLYREYIYAEEYYGKEKYSEIDYRCSEDEAEVGNMIIETAYQVVNYTGLEENAEREIGDVGALEEFYYFKENTQIKHQYGDFQFVTCKINENRGTVWVIVTVKRYDENEKFLSGIRDNPSRFEIEKQGEKWIVTNVDMVP